MNILYINHYAGSPEMGMEFRPYYFAREWVKMGHHVDIIAGDYSHLRRKNPKVTEDFQKDTIDGINYYWIKTGKYDGNGVRRAMTMGRFVGKLWLKAKWIAKEFKPDAIICSSTYPIDTFAGQRIRKFTRGGGILVHEIHDMWPISPMELGNMSKYNPFIIAMQIGENSFCRKSDKIVSLLPAASPYLQEHGMSAEKFNCVANGIVLDEWSDVESLPQEHLDKLKEIRNRHKYIVGFFGSHTNSYALTYLIDAVRQFDSSEICAVFVGSGIAKEELIEYANGAENIYFLPPVPKRSIPALLQEMDILYVGAVNNKMLRFGICMNKLFDSMMSGKPILYAVNAPNNYIRDYNCGVSVEPESVDALKNGIVQMMQMSPEKLQEMGENGHAAVVQHFEYSVLAQKFLEAMK